MRLVDAQYTEVYLAGELGKRFGRKRRLVCRDPGEALRLIGLERPDFKAYMIERAKAGARYHVIVDKRSRTEEELGLPAGRRLIISPEVVGAKGDLGSILEIVVGVVLIAFTWWTGIGGYTGGALISMGAGLILSGVTGLLTKLQTGSANSLQSYAFNGPTDNAQQGSPVPVVYGLMMIGGQAISATLQAVDMSSAATETGLLTSIEG